MALFVREHRADFFGGQFMQHAVEIT